MGKPFLLQLSSVLVQQRDLLKLGMVIDSYNDHCSAPFSRACWLAYAPPTLLGSGSRHCHGINYTNYREAGLTVPQNRRYASPSSCDIRARSTCSGNALFAADSSSSKNSAFARLSTRSK